VVVVEVRQPFKWVGGPRKLCHATTHEIAYTTRNAPAGPDGDIGISGLVLMLGFDDCQITLSEIGQRHPPLDVVLTSVRLSY
jgi:hypothetical protein